MAISLGSRSNSPFKGSVRAVNVRSEVDGEIKTRTYQVKIPAGVVEGQRLRIPGRGEAGAGGGAAGDLYLRVRLARLIRSRRVRGLGCRAGEVKKGCALAYGAYCRNHGSWRRICSKQELRLRMGGWLRRV